MTTWIRSAVQIIVLIALFGAVAAFSDWPRYQQINPQSAIIKFSFTHGSNRESECRRRSAEELARLPANMRKPLDCPRSRGSLYVELDVDGQSVYRAVLPPSGISHDGPSRVYKRFVVTAGSHSIVARLRDTPRTEGFDFVKSGEIVLAANQNFVIDFRAEAGGFVFR